jgi:hypothetical protein
VQGSAFASALGTTASTAPWNATATGIVSDGAVEGISTASVAGVSANGGDPMTAAAFNSAAGTFEPGFDAGQYSSADVVALPASVAFGGSDPSVAAAFDATGATVIAAGSVSAINEQGGTTAQTESVQAIVDLTTHPLSGYLAIGLLDASVPATFLQMTVAASDSVSGSSLTIDVTMALNGLHSGGLDGFDFVIGTTPTAPTESGLGGTFSSAAAALAALTPDTMFDLGHVPIA